MSVPKWVMEVTCEKLVRNILHGRTEVTLGCAIGQIVLYNEPLSVKESDYFRVSHGAFTPGVHKKRFKVTVEEID